MRKVFNSAFRVTQEFGVNETYYKQFGLKGHEGIDLVPTGTVRDIYALEDGVVVLDDDVVGSVSADPYGKLVTIWHNKINKATMYCHLKENFVTQGQIVKRGDKIGTMGGTGNVQGDHLHLNLFETDVNGNRLNKDNGYLGGTDPLPFLNEDVQAPETSIDVLQQEIVKLRVELNDLDRQKKEWEDKATIADNFRKSLSKKLFNNEESQWQQIYDEVSKAINDNDDTQSKAALSLRLWEAIQTKTGTKYIYPEQEVLLLQDLENFNGVVNKPVELSRIGHLLKAIFG